LSMNISEKILARASGRELVHAGEIVKAKVDVAMMPDLTAILSFKAMMETGRDRVWDPDKIVLVMDHVAPASTLNAANVHKELRKTAKEQGIKHFYDVNEGVCHQVLPEKGHVKPGTLVVGADSHTCTHGAFGAFATGVGSTDMGAVLATGKLWLKVPETIRVEVNGTLPNNVAPKDVILRVIGDIGADGATYNAVVFSGDTVEAMSISGRMTLCRSDSNAEYKAVHRFEVGGLEPQVACPDRVDNVKPVSKVEGTRIDQVFLGSCTNGRMEDLEAAASILRGKQVHPDVRLLVVPASKGVYVDALDAGLLRVFAEAGGLVCNPSCGVCFGGHIGILAPGEVGLATSNRNFRGRQGSPESEVYLASPVTAAASAVKGVITDPRDLR